MGVQREFPNCRLFDQHVGLFYNRRGTPVNIGVKGQADLNGIIKVGAIGIRVEIEIKTGAGRQTKEQKNWQRMIENMGGIYIVARSVEQVIEEIHGKINRVF